MASNSQLQSIKEFNFSFIALTDEEIIDLLDKLKKHKAIAIVKLKFLNFNDKIYEALY